MAATIGITGTMADTTKAIFNQRGMGYDITPYAGVLMPG
jgi:hypothetical protein